MNPNDFKQNLTYEEQEYATPESPKSSTNFHVNVEKIDAQTDSEQMNKKKLLEFTEKFLNDMKDGDVLLVKHTKYNNSVHSIQLSKGFYRKETHKTIQEEPKNASIFSSIFFVLPWLISGGFLVKTIMGSKGFLPPKFFK